MKTNELKKLIKARFVGASFIAETENYILFKAIDCENYYTIFEAIKQEKTGLWFLRHETRISKQKTVYLFKNISETTKAEIEKEISVLNKKIEQATKKENLICGFYSEKTEFKKANRHFLKVINSMLTENN